MPKVKWDPSLSPDTVDEFDRESRFKPYAGPQPPKGLYCWRIKQLRYQPTPEGSTKLPAFRIGLELVPRKSRPEERQYAGYFIMDFLPISQQTDFRWVPFLDALGVSGREFFTGTVTDESGNINKMGRWTPNKTPFIMAQLGTDTDQNGMPRYAITPGGFWSVEEVQSEAAAAAPAEESDDDYAAEEGDAEEEYAEEEGDAEADDGEEYVEEEPEEEPPPPPPPPRKAAKKAAPAKRAAPAKKAAPAKRTRAAATQEEGWDEAPF